MRVAVVGAGIAGLSIAHALARDATAGADVQVFEAAGRVGGNLWSERIDGLLCEHGPNGFLDNEPATLALVDALGIANRVLPSNDAARRRFIFRRGRLHQVPAGPLGFFTSPVLSARGRARVLAEPFARARPAGDESIHAFAARRIGKEAADVLVGAMVSGIFAGDARELSLRACFPRMWQMETEHGGLMRAAISKRRRRRGTGGGTGMPSGRLTSFKNGIEELPLALARALDARVCTAAAVVRLDTGNGRRAWTLTLERGEETTADAVVLAVPPSRAAELAAPLDAVLADALRAISSAPLAVVCLGFDRAALDHPLDGFGFLAPRGEGLRCLGALWESSVYAERAPAGRALIRVMCGGAHDPSAIALSDEELTAAARADLARAMGLTAVPLFVRIFRHAVGIPQYTLGHLARLELIESRLSGLPGLFVAGNGYRGVSINACVADARSVAARVLAVRH